MLSNKFFPYSSMQEINLDWILTKVKNLMRFLPDDGSVGQILRRTAHGAEWSNEQGGGGAVTSVNGQTGDVVLSIPDSTSDLINDSGFVDAAGAAAAAPVQKVNGQTGTVTINKTSVGLGNVANVLQYSASNPPPYPVTSVNTQTGDVVLSIPDSTSDLVNDSGFVNAAGAAAAAPVQSVNGQTGAVTIPVPTKTIVKGQIMRGAGAGAEGYGVAEITYMGSLVRIDFAMKLETASYTGDDYGIDPTLFDSSITPIEGGTVTYFKSNGAMDTDRMGYGGTFENRNNAYWKPARIYTTGGAVGSWAANVIGAGETLVGTCFGTKT